MCGYVRRIKECKWVYQNRELVYRCVRRQRHISELSCLESSGVTVCSTRWRQGTIRGLLHHSSSTHPPFPILVHHSLTHSPSLRPLTLPHPLILPSPTSSTPTLTHLQLPSIFLRPLILIQPPYPAALSLSPVS